jgi:D-glycero-alpha-D-manno-heptose 1-phosphate guanylyltransferase
MEAIILAGGKGTRLKDVVRDMPKPMAPIGGKPFLEYLLLQLIRWNVRDIILSVGYKFEAIQNYFEDGNRWNVRIRYSVENKPLGTGGAIREAARLLAKDNFLVMNGDSYCDLDFDSFSTFHSSSNASLSLALVALDDVRRYGRVTLNNSGHVLNFEEKTAGGGPGLINSGIYLFNRDILPFFPLGDVSFEQIVLPHLIGKRLYGMQVKAFFIDIGVPEDYFYLKRHYKDYF